MSLGIRDLTPEEQQRLINHAIGNAHNSERTLLSRIQLSLLSLWKKITGTENPLLAQQEMRSNMENLSVALIQKNAPEARRILSLVLPQFSSGIRELQSVDNACVRDLFIAAIQQQHKPNNSPTNLTDYPTLDLTRALHDELGIPFLEKMPHKQGQPLKKLALGVASVGLVALSAYAASSLLPQSVSLAVPVDSTPFSLDLWNPATPSICLAPLTQLPGLFNTEPCVFSENQIYRCLAPITNVLHSTTSALINTTHSVPADLSPMGNDFSPLPGPSFSLSLSEATPLNLSICPLLQPPSLPSFSTEPNISTAYGVTKSASTKPHTHKKEPVDFTLPVMFSVLAAGFVAFKKALNFKNVVPQKKADPLESPLPKSERPLLVITKEIRKRYPEGATNAQIRNWELNNNPPNATTSQKAEKPGDKSSNRGKISTRRDSETTSINSLDRAVALEVVQPKAPTNTSVIPSQVLAETKNPQQPPKTTQPKKDAPRPAEEATDKENARPTQPIQTPGKPLTLPAPAAADTQDHTGQPRTTTTVSTRKVDVKHLRKNYPLGMTDARIRELEAARATRSIQNPPSKISSLSSHPLEIAVSAIFPSTGKENIRSQEVDRNNKSGVTGRGLSSARLDEPPQGTTFYPLPRSPSAPLDSLATPFSLNKYTEDTGDKAISPKSPSHTEVEAQQLKRTPSSQSSSMSSSKKDGASATPLKQGQTAPPAAAEEINFRTPQTGLFSPFPNVHKGLRILSADKGLFLKANETARGSQGSTARNVASREPNPSANKSFQSSPLRKINFNQDTDAAARPLEQTPKASSPPRGNDSFQQSPSPQVQPRQHSTQKIVRTESEEAFRGLDVEFNQTEKPAVKSFSSPQSPLAQRELTSKEREHNREVIAAKVIEARTRRGFQNKETFIIEPSLRNYLTTQPEAAERDPLLQENPALRQALRVLPRSLGTYSLAQLNQQKKYSVLPPNNPSKSNPIFEEYKMQFEEYKMQKELDAAWAAHMKKIGHSA